MPLFGFLYDFTLFSDSDLVFKNIIQNKFNEVLFISCLMLLLLLNLQKNFTEHKYLLQITRN